MVIFIFEVIHDKAERQPFFQTPLERAADFSPLELK
jgi:hypothetical protein